MPDIQKTRITGIGNALVDLLIKEKDSFLKALNKEKGGMTFVEDEEIEQILSQSKSKLSIVPGGAACNTIVGVGSLGGKASFIGRRGNDVYGKSYEEQLIKCNVEPVVSVSDTSPTGKALSVITPDAQRSMLTFLGASTEMDPLSVRPELFCDSAITMVEGYLLFNRELMTAALKAAKKAGSLIALDLASFEVVNAAKDILGDLIKSYVDILIANEDEAKAYTGLEDEIKTVQMLAKDVAYGVLKIGAKGSYVCCEDKITKIEPKSGKDPVDTTGAGDLWAAGFLFGLANGYSIEKSGELASACGYEVCQVIGAQIPPAGWDRIKTII
ncbi:MAG: adenosine kinase [Desulfobacteraceae bacterium]|nr:adenosine kinase [Desulfobacteraceae bacterium]